MLLERCGKLLDWCGLLLDCCGLQVAFSYIQLSCFQIEVISKVESSGCLTDGGVGVLLDCCRMLLDCSGWLLGCCGLGVAFSYVQLSFYQIEIICRV